LLLEDVEEMTGEAVNFTVVVEQDEDEATEEDGAEESSEISAPENPIDFSWQALAMIIYVPNFIVNCGFCMLPPVLPLFAKLELGCDDSIIGLIVAANGFGQVTKK